MASASVLLSEEQFLCSICLDVFTDPVSTPCGHNYCKACITRHWDTGHDACKCPLCNKTFRGRPEVLVNTLISEMVDQFRSNKLKEEREKTANEVRQMILERRLKIQEVKRSVELSRKDADRAVAIGAQLYAALIGCIERSRAELVDAIEDEQKAAEKRAEGLVEDLQREVAELEKRIAETKQLSPAEDHPLAHKDPSAGWKRPTGDWTKVNVQPPSSSCLGTLRTAVARLEETFDRELKKQLCDVELRSIQQHEVDVTLDADTANPYLVLSDDGKQVSCGTVWKRVPNNAERFSLYAHVLGKQSLSTGRFYFEVRVTGKTKWSLGVARESVNRKDITPLSPDNGYWTIWLMNGVEYQALADPRVLLPIRERVQKVGVFVDYEEGLVSFYDVETRDLLYSFAGCIFTETLRPFFGPCSNDGGTNAAPLVISAVDCVD